MTIDLTPRNVRNAIIIGMVFGMGVTISNAVISDIRWAMFPPSWAKPMECPKPID